jgi:signal transduction histidine kinase
MARSPSGVTTTPQAPTTVLWVTTEGQTTQPMSVARRDPSLRTELRIASGVLRGLRDDLFSGAFAVRPLAPLASPPPLLRLPAPVREYARWLPHAAIMAATFVLGLATARGWGVHHYFQGEDNLSALLIGISLISVLWWSMGAWWLSFATLWFTAGQGIADTWPWMPGSFVSHILVMMAVAARSRPRVAFEMWLITTALGVGFELEANWYSGSNTVPMVIISFLALLAVVLMRGWWESRREVDAQVAVTVRERSRRTLLEERTTIARELHDVVAHHMSVVAIQAEAAPYRVADTPPELEKAFATIRENALTALTELRRVLGVVRAADYEAPGAPQPTLAELGGLLDNVRDAGLPVEKAVTGAVRELPQGIELSAYRIVQEALSNSMRHAPGAEARVELSYVLGGLGLRIVNGPPRGQAKPSTSPGGAGHGLTGMRERVGMLNGEMTAGPTRDGGYETVVFLPVPAVPGPSATPDVAEGSGEAAT